MTRAFRLLWFGEGVSLLGTSTAQLLLPLLAVLTFDAGPAAMGALTATTWLPWLVIGLPACAWVDGWSARRTMIAADLVSAAAMGSIPLAALGGALTMPQLYVVAALTGTATVFFRAAYPRLVAVAVPPERYTAANARLSGVEAATQVVGPGLGGVLAQAASAAAGLLLDAASFLVSALSLARIRVDAPRARSAGTPLRTRVRAGLRFVLRDRYLRWFTVLGGLSNFGITGFETLMVLFLVRDLGLSSGTVGLFFAACSAGGVAGAALAGPAARRLGSARATVVLQLGAAAGVLVPLGGPGRLLALPVAGMFVLVACVVALNVIRAGWRLSYVPSELMGRVVTSAQLVNYGTMPVAGVVAGALGAALGLRAAIAVLVGVHALACLLILASPIRRLRELPAPVGQTPAGELVAA